MRMQVGSVVQAKAGHDRLCWYAVLFCDGNMAWLCDGKRRKLMNPKKKKYCHLAETNTVLPSSCLETDRQLRMALARFARQPDDTEDIQEAICQNRT